MSNRCTAKIKIDRDKLTSAITDRGWTIRSFVKACEDRPFWRLSERSFRRYMSNGALPYAVFSEVVSFLRIYPDEVIADGELNNVIFIEREIFSGSDLKGAQWKFKDSDIVYSWYAQEKSFTTNQFAPGKITNEDVKKAIKTLIRIRDESSDWTPEAWYAFELAIYALSKFAPAARSTTDTDVRDLSAKWLTPDTKHCLNMHD